MCSPDNINVTTFQNGATLVANDVTGPYQWLDCDNNFAPISGATNQIFNATTPGNYAVAISQVICSDTSACLLVQSIGIEEIINTEITAYPNPAVNSIEISGLTQQQNYSIYTMQGDELLKGSVSPNEKIDVSELTNGIYFLKIGNGGTLKFIKE
ncbi:MAG: T9SS type A sorting domain-containing protein [Crocinitomicaceae bacterium]|nr:T9SS type A sorting domain-containing protein [Crocinitomicaceae bacterium]